MNTAFKIAFRNFVITGLLFAACAANAKSLTRSEILDRTLQLDSSEVPSEQALQELKAEPRAKLIQIFRKELNAPKPDPRAIANVARAATRLELKELAPDLEKFAVNGTDWVVLNAFSELADKTSTKKIAKVYEARLALNSVSPPAKIAMLDSLRSWREPISFELFQQLAREKSFEVRLAVVQQFILTRGKFTARDQAARFALAMTLKPYEVRLTAVRAFASLSLEERHRLRSAEPESCAAEPNELVKTLCLQIKNADGGQ